MSQELSSRRFGLKCQVDFSRRRLELFAQQRHLQLPESEVAFCIPGAVAKSCRRLSSRWALLKSPVACYMMRLYYPIYWAFSQSMGKPFSAANNPIFLGTTDSSLISSAHDDPNWDASVETNRCFSGFGGWWEWTLYGHQCERLWRTGLCGDASASCTPVIRFYEQKQFQSAPNMHRFWFWIRVQLVEGCWGGFRISRAPSFLVRVAVQLRFLLWL